MTLDRLEFRHRLVLPALLLAVAAVAASLVTAQVSRQAGSPP